MDENIGFLRCCEYWYVFSPSPSRFSFYLIFPFSSLRAIVNHNSAASANDHIPALGQLADFDPLKLKNVGGVVGVEEKGAENSTLLNGMGEEGVEHNSPIKLALEAPGIIKRGVLRRD
jgi:hypothetical protein